MRLLINEKNIDVNLESYPRYELNGYDNKWEFINNDINIKVIFDLLSENMTIIFIDSKSSITYNIDKYVLTFIKDIEEIEIDKINGEPMIRLFDQKYSNYR